MPKWQGYARLQLARALESRPVTAAAFAAGEIIMDAATAVCDAIEALPASVPAAISGEVEEFLLQTARQEGSRRSTRRAMEITYRFAPEVLEEQEAAARQDRFVSLTTRADGTVALRGQLDKEAGALALAVSARWPHQPRPPTASPTRETPARYADAFVQLCQLPPPTCPKCAGSGPRRLTISLESLEAKAAGRRCAPAMLDTGIPLSIEATRRMLCDANVIPIVLGSHGEPLDVGRAPAPSPPASAAHWSRATKAARSPAATGPRRGATPTTANIGPTAAKTALLQPLPVMQPSPRRRAPRRLGHHLDQRDAVVHPTRVDRPRPNTTTTQPTQNTTQLRR